MRSRPTRSGPIRWEQPRSPSANPTRSRPSTSKRGFWKAPSRVAGASRAFAGRSRPQDGYSPHGDRSHGARRKGATANDDLALGSRPGRGAWRVARRPQGNAEISRREVALAALTTGPVPGPMRAAEDRPVSRRAYFPLKVCRSGTPALTDAIFILAHPLPSLKPGGSPGPKEEG